jgi:alkylation response protein AidB-like acyl-CoA dehydrogenase
MLRTLVKPVLRASFGGGAARQVSPHALRGFKTTAVTQYKAPLREMDFLLNDVLDVESHFKKMKATGGEYVDKDTVLQILESHASFCEETLGPLNEVGDQVGCKWVDEHTVKTPPGYKEAYDIYREGGWQGLSNAEEWGGQGLPYSLSLFSSDMAATANFTWTMYPGLSKGCINTMISHASDELKQKYLPNLVSGQWTGTMCLTEPQCGSDLGQVNTKAVPVGDGKYKLTGTKIFISCGEHDMTDNIIHCVLARLPDAPSGTRGISLFLVPKRLVDQAGEVGELNGCKIGRIEDKMGCHGSSTCEINFEDAEGYMIGEENKGLNHMFTFINTSRVGTAVQGVAAAELSYQGSLWYAKERLAMRSLSGKKNPDGPADPIIVHPTVRRLLLTQKVIAEGGRSMIYECGLLNDERLEAEANGDVATAKAIEDRLGFLTPILKGFLTEVGIEAANMGIQVYGGHGYIKSNKQEQIVRDSRISAVWEGTTQIQALDLLGRKIMLEGKMRPINEHSMKIYKFTTGLIMSGATSSVKKHAFKLLKEAASLHIQTYKIAGKANSNRDAIGLASQDYLMISGYINLAHHWLRMEEIASKKLASGEGDAEFYESKVKSSEFYFENIFPRILSHKATMNAPLDSVMSMKDNQFSFDHAL